MISVRRPIRTLRCVSSKPIPGDSSAFTITTKVSAANWNHHKIHICDPTDAAWSLKRKYSCDFMLKFEWYVIYDLERLTAMYIRLFKNINRVTQRKLYAVSGGRYTEAMKYSSVSIKRLMARSIVMEWNIHIFSGRTRVAKPEPAEANPTIVASCTALHNRSKTESRAKRISNRVTWSHVNQIIPKKQTYDHSATSFLSCLHTNTLLRR